MPSIVRIFPTDQSGLRTEGLHPPYGWFSYSCPGVKGPLIADTGWVSMNYIFWWLRQIVLVLVGCFFLALGIHTLILAYHLKDPFSFVMTFFASNLIILISATLVVGFIIRMVKVYKDLKITEE